MYMHIFSSSVKCNKECISSLLYPRISINKMRLILFSVFVITFLLNRIASCLQQYHEFEAKFWTVEENLDKLQELFYPTNKASPSFIVVDYSCVNENNETTIPCTIVNSNPLGFIHFPHKINQYCEEDHNTSQFCNWMWTDSAIYLVYSPAVLNVLAYFADSFFTITYHNMLQLHIPILCDEVAKDHIKKLTTRVRNNFVCIAIVLYLTVEEFGKR